MGKSSNTILLPEARLEGLRNRLGTEVRARRRAAGLTQSELADPLTKAYVALLEAGRVLPSLPAFIALAERLGVAPDELLREVNGH
ncbi:MAG TPA: helix-turn-helix transcriptional regulator [Candidatus Limnocylindrales bacterium]|nr:helix-turn-helix transcriptional regulator [Candidatus Limnocylindrales bacterium]